MAAIAGLEALKRPCRVRLHTDSQYVRDGITKWIHGWKARGWHTADKKPVKNIDLWQRLEAAAGRHQVDWDWVRGHAGHPENERADALARAAIAASAPTGPGQRPPASGNCGCGTTMSRASLPGVLAGSAKAVCRRPRRASPVRSRKVLSRGVRSSRRSATTWMTLSSRCNLPVQRSRVAPSAARRKRSRIGGQTIRLAIPVSSSMVMKTTPLALPGRWRISTIPAIASRRSTGRSGEVGGGDQPLAGELGAQKGQRMALQAEAEAGVILDDMLAQRHLRQQGRGAGFAVSTFPLTLPSRPMGGEGFSETAVGIIISTRSPSPSPALRGAGWW